MKLNRFEVVTGRYIEEIPGQSRIGYVMSDATDFYDMIEWSKKGGYQGSTLSFYDYNNGKVYEPFQNQKNVLYGTPVNIEDVNLYNLRIIGEDVYIVSEDDEFVSYYPESFRFSKGVNESVSMIADQKVYLSAWVEEGWDDENDCETEEYNYYEKVVERDFKGNLLSEKLGSLQQHSDGTWWIT